jgi:hypothetical protein
LFILLAAAAGSPGLAACYGDLDNDRDADGADLALFIADFGRADCATGPPCRGDIYPIGTPDDAVDGSAWRCLQPISDGRIAPFTPP